MPVVVLSVTLLAAGSGPHSSTVDVPASLLAAPAYAQNAALVAQVPSPTLAPSASPSASASPPPSTSASPSAPATTSAPPVPTTPPPVRPVAGLNQRQMANAAAIVKQGRAQGMPDRALVVAIATAMQESNLYNVASSAVPSSLRLPHEGVSSDHDSVGLFQQRASQGWGTVPELMKPAHSAMLFYKALSRVRGWQGMSVTAAAQAVQRSAFPNAYQKHASRAEQIVAALT